MLPGEGRGRPAAGAQGTGKEARGSGTAAALVTAQLKDEGEASRVLLTTDLTISGKAAQFGRGVLADVATNLVGNSPSGSRPSCWARPRASLRMKQPLQQHFPRRLNKSRWIW
ncbi:carbon monoxide dehydrogenase subunit G family protein [Mycobacterium xenopi 3993]|nr:carbon monoxide dehydrogenase subunit G family protein [Mycobacterium xenopi 3993]